MTADVYWFGAIILGAIILGIITFGDAWILRRNRVAARLAKEHAKDAAELERQRHDEDNGVAACLYKASPDTRDRPRDKGK